MKNNKGFTFLEVAMIFAIAGFILAPMYYLLFSAMRLGPTDQRMEAIRYGIGEYYRVWGRLPCPADITAAPGDAAYASEVRGGSNVCTLSIDAGTAWIGAVPVEDLAAAMDCLSGDARDNYIAGLPTDAQGTLQRSLMRLRDADKGVTIKSGIQKQNCVTIDMLLDEHGSKFVYAVSKATTRIATFDPHATGMGAINIIDSAGNNLSAQPQWFAIASMGEDKKGAYDRFGNRPFTCTSSPGLDQENCDLADATFRSMPTSKTGTANHFDDRVDYSLDNALSEHSFWYWKDDNEDGVRDMTFQPDTRMIIDTPASVNADDKVVLGQGSLAVKQGGGASGNIEVQGAGKGFYSPSYCYNGSSC